MFERYPPPRPRPGRSYLSVCLEFMLRLVGLKSCLGQWSNRAIKGAESLGRETDHQPLRLFVDMVTFEDTLLLFFWWCLLTKEEGTESRERAEVK